MNTLFRMDLMYGLQIKNSKLYAYKQKFRVLLVNIKYDLYREFLLLNGFYSSLKTPHP